MQGSSCRYLHRIPTADDERTLPTGQDCFGRERHVEDRNDMGGVGSFSRTRFVLFIGRITEMDSAKVEVRTSAGHAAQVGASPTTC